MFASIAADLVGYSLPLVGGGILAGAVLAFLYVPLVGKQLAVGLIALAAATFAFDLGFNERASLDKSAVLQSEIVTLKANATEAQRQAAATKQIAADATIAEQNAEDQTAITQQKVDEYAAELAKTATPACGLSDDDVSRLRGIGSGPAGHSAKPSKRSANIRAPDPGSSSS